MAWSTVAQAVAAPIATIDQQNLGPFSGTNGSGPPIYFGQSFRPTLSGLDAVEFLLGGTNTTAIVEILSGLSGADGLGGPIIATSMPTFFTGNLVVHFDFAGTVPLTPGQTYVARLLNTAGSIGVRHTSGNAYAGGQFLHQGFSPGVFAGNDLVFAEGLHALATVPEPASAAMWSLAACSLLAWRRRHSFAGTI